MRAPVFSSNLAAHIEGLIEHKRSLGYLYESAITYLTAFDRMCSERFPCKDSLDYEIAMAWAVRRDGEHPNTQARRISQIRVLAQYINRLGDSAYVFPKGVPNREIRYVPHIYTKEEIIALLDAADDMPCGRKGGVKHLVVPCALRLLYATGMRHGEARLLAVQDVDLTEGMIRVGRSKNSEGRLVPVCGSVLQAMRAYDAKMSKIVPGREWFFSRADGQHFSESWLQQEFVALKYMSGIEDGTAKRLHDIRHSFCVHRLNAWIMEGKDVRSLLPYLSAYVGHKTLESTDYYLHLVPEFFKDFSSLVYGRNELLPEVSGDEKGV